MHRVRERAVRATARAVRASSAAFDAVRAPVTRAYEATMRENAEFVVRDPTRAKRLGREFVYTNLARVPGAMRAAAAEVEVVKELGTRARMGELDVATAATGRRSRRSSTRGSPWARSSGGGGSSRGTEGRCGVLKSISVARCNFDRRKGSVVDGVSFARRAFARARRLVRSNATRSLLESGRCSTGRDVRHGIEAKGVDIELVLARVGVVVALTTRRVGAPVRHLSRHRFAAFR